MSRRLAYVSNVLERLEFAKLVSDSSCKVYEGPFLANRESTSETSKEADEFSNHSLKGEVFVDINSRQDSL